MSGRLSLTQARNLEDYLVGHLHTEAIYDEGSDSSLTWLLKILST